MLNKSNWEGVGMDNYKKKYLYHQAQYFAFGRGSEQEKLLADNTCFAFNDYFELVVELGWPGLILLIALIILFIYMLVEVYRKPFRDSVAWLVVNRFNSALTSAGSTAIDFYKSNASITVVTASGNYIVTVADWLNIGSLGSTASLTTTFNNEAAQYFNANPTATQAEASEYALLKTFGNTINLYKAPLNSTNYKPRKIDTTSNKAVDKPC